MMEISIHALLAESDVCLNGLLSGRYHFYPRSPCGERPPKKAYNIIKGKISIHALLAESDFHLFASSGVDFSISIHALLAESDPLNCFGKIMSVSFLSTLSLRRATVGRSQGRWQLDGFLSTLSLRRATILGGRQTRTRKYFYPRSPCGERPI